MMLDHIEKFTLSEDALSQHFNELESLRCLAEGLAFLYEKVKRIETTIVERNDASLLVFSYGNDPNLPWVPQRLIACYFHWYAVSACNYVRLVGWLRHIGNQSSPTALEYVKSVLPEVKPWRDKVGAHFAKSADSRCDTYAEREASVFFPIAFYNDAFFAHPIQLTVVRSGKRSTSNSLRQWSLTKIHEQLRPRYWPASSPGHHNDNEQ